MFQSKRWDYRQIGSWGRIIEMTAPRDVSWKWLIPALTVPTLGALCYFFWFPEGVLGKTAYTSTKVFTLFYPLLFLGVLGTAGLFRRREVANPPTMRSVILLGLGSGIAISLLGWGLMMTPLGDQVWAGSLGVIERAEGLGFREHFVLFALYVTFVHSALEEYYWRWFVFGSLERKIRPWLAHAIAGVAFGGHHLVILMQFFPFGLAAFFTSCVVIGGVIWTWLYARQGSVLGCWLSHLCVDAFLMILGYQLIMNPS